MKVSIENINPDYARDLLKGNIANRTSKTRHVKRLADLMESGDWQENGEAFIIGTDGILKDGQHRLQACIMANHSFKAVIVRGVDANVMSTIDTGVNRSLADVLQLNGFSYTCEISGLIKLIQMYKRGGGVKAGGTEVETSNKFCLEYALKHKEMLTYFAKAGKSLYQKGDRVVPANVVMFLGWLVSRGEHLSEEQIMYLKNITSIVKVEGNSSAYVLKVLTRMKLQKVQCNQTWRMGLLIKAWNNFAQGDPVVNYLKYDIVKPLPKVF